MLKKSLRYLAAVVLLIAPLTHVPAQDSKREITQIAGDLYRFQNNFHFSVFLVTPEGVIASDPINAEAAQWLKDEIARRFDQPIKYVFYSHHHADHISGGEVFADEGVTIIAHENAVAGIEQDNVPTAEPTETFSDQMTIELGGRKVELIYLGKNHSDNSIVALFPDERVVFAVDFVSAQRLPYRTLTRSYFPDWFDSMDKLAALDFDILAPGHGMMGTRQDAIDHGQYLRDLYAAVKEGKESGKSVAELQESIKLEQYKDWGQYDPWLKENIEGMYGYVSN